MTDTTLLTILTVVLIIGIIFIVWLAHHDVRKKMEADLREDQEYRAAMKRKFDANREMAIAEHLIREQQNKWREMNEERKLKNKGK